MVRLSCSPDVLRSLALFSGLSDAQFGAVLPHIQRRLYPADSRIVHAGGGADGLYVVVSGRARLLFNGGAGRELIAASIGPSEFFGEIGVIDGHAPTANVDAEETCEILFVPRAVLLECVEHNAAAAMAMLRTVIGRLDDAYRSIAALALADVGGARGESALCPPYSERH